MDAAGDIVAVSFPFTAGVALAAALPQEPWAFASAGCAGAAVLLAGSLFKGARERERRLRSPEAPESGPRELEGLFYSPEATRAVAPSRRMDRIMLAAAFFFLGMMCFGNAAAGAIGAAPGAGAADGRIAALAGKGLAWLQGLIDGVPWGRRGTEGLLRALLSGDRGGLDPAVRGAIRSAGASHILALSGLHLGIIYAIIAKGLGVLGHSPAAIRLRAALTIAICGLYTVVTGAGPSLVRAFLFITLNETLRLCPGRSRNPLNILCTALIVQLIFDPLIIRSLGFQLSYLAMTGIFVVYPRLKAWYPGERAVSAPLTGSGKESRTGSQVRNLPATAADKVSRLIWNSAALSISCQLLTAPLVWLRFGTFPQYFLLTNLIAMPLTSALMVTAVASISLSAAGICPSILVRITNAIASALTSSLEIIASM
ncbi:MAG: ComEC/Rec2 family competence protein [Bacteroidales bacterium]|nr:ComEC/Rec2 family competence protein [Bacteroidales bacterium]